LPNSLQTIRYFYNIKVRIEAKPSIKAPTLGDVTTWVSRGAGNYIYEMYIYDKNLLQYHYLWFSFTGLKKLSQGINKSSWPKPEDCTQIYNAGTTYHRASVIVHTLDNYLMNNPIGGITELFATNDSVLWASREIYHHIYPSTTGARREPQPPTTPPPALNDTFEAANARFSTFNGRWGDPSSEDERKGEAPEVEESPAVKEANKMKELGEEFNALAEEFNSIIDAAGLAKWAKAHDDRINLLLNVFSMNNTLLVVGTDGPGFCSTGGKLAPNVLCRINASKVWTDIKVYGGDDGSAREGDGCVEVIYCLTGNRRVINNANNDYCMWSHLRVYKNDHIERRIRDLTTELCNRTGLGGLEFLPALRGQGLNATMRAVLDLGKSK
jgi:hypothetical protein